MAERLKLISKQTPWFLVIKAALFGVAWFFLPWWVFLGISCALYFLPAFQTARLMVPFLLLLGFSMVWPMGIDAMFRIGLAVTLGILFFFILGIKELIFINRKLGFEILAILLLFLTYLTFFSRITEWNTPSLIVWAFSVAAIFFLLGKNAAHYHFEKRGGDMQGETREAHRIRVGLGVVSLLVWQMLTVLLVVPLTAYEQTAIMTLASAILLELLNDYFDRRLVRRKTLIGISFFFTALVFILATAEWSL